MPAGDGTDADLAGLADAGLARWVAEVRQASGPSWREAGAAALRQDSRRRAAARPPGPALPLVRDLGTADDGRPGLPLRLYRPATEPRPLVLSCTAAASCSAIWSRTTASAVGWL